MSQQPLYEIGNPAGIWRCTRSTFADFVVGQEYPCLRSQSGGHRIYPRLHQRAWSPYWVADKARFCYAAAKLDFVFVRPLSASEQDRLAQARDRTPPPDLSHISFPLVFADDAPATAAPKTAPRKGADLIRLGQAHARDVAIFLIGAASAGLASFAI